MRQALADQQEDLKDQRRMMEEQSYQLGILTRHLLTVTADTATATTNVAEDAKEADTKRLNQSGSGESDNSNVSGGRDVAVADVFSTAPSQAPGNVNVKACKVIIKPHTAIPPKANTAKSNYSNPHHRTSFNGSTNIINNTSNFPANASVSNSNSYRHPAPQLPGQQAVGPGSALQGLQQEEVTRPRLRSSDDVELSVRGCRLTY